MNYIKSGIEMFKRLHEIVKYFRVQLSVYNGRWFLAKWAFEWSRAVFTVVR